MDGQSAGNSGAHHHAALTADQDVSERPTSPPLQPFPFPLTPARSESSPTVEQVVKSDSPPPKVKVEPNLPQAVPFMSLRHPSVTVVQPSSASRSPRLSESSSTQRQKRSYYLIDAEEDDDVGPYDSSKEPLPQKIINAKRFPEAERLACSSAHEILDILREHAYSDEDFDYIKDLAQKATFINYPKGVKIGLRGDSGTGKSSVINSLLGVQNIAPQSDGGAACTSVVQEFLKPRPNQRNPCESEITFLSHFAREAILKEWLKDVFIFEHSGADADDDMFEQYEELASTAIDGLFSLFCDREECESPEAIKKILSNAQTQDDGAIISKLKGWTEDFLNDLGAVSGMVTVTEASPELVQDKIAPYLQHVHTYTGNGRLAPSPWPFVVLVRTYFDSPILSQDIVLADLPGTSDINQTRVRASQRYLKDADYIGVVSRIDRAETDSATHRYLLDAFKRKRGANVLFVATCSDSVNIKANHLNRHINNAEAVHAANLTELKEQLAMVDVELAGVKREINKARSCRDRDAVEELDERQRNLKTTQVSLGAKISEYCIRMRNTKVSSSMSQMYASLTKDPVPLPVFCISNSEYATHLLGYHRDYPPKMGVDTTEIPKLRAFLYGLPADRKHRAFKHHCSIVIPSLLNNLDMTCSQTKLMRREELHKILISAADPIASELQKVFDSFISTAIVPGVAIIKTKKLAYAQHAVGTLSNWAKWKNATHKAFCARKGSWKTKAVGAHNWNQIMLQPLLKDVEKDIAAWDDPKNILVTSLSEKLSTMTTNLISQLEGAAGASKSSMESYFSELRLKRELLDSKCQDRVEILQRDLGFVKENLTNTADTKTCYFVQILSGTYEECTNVTGAGAAEARTNLLKEKLSGKVRGPFLELYKMVQNASTRVVQQHANEFVTEVRETFMEFTTLFLRVFKADQTDTPEAKRLREELCARVPDWKRVLAEDVERCLVSCQEYADSG